jgi:hypothetical protein
MLEDFSYAPNPLPHGAHRQIFMEFYRTVQMLFPLFEGKEAGIKRSGIQALPETMHFLRS